MSSTISEAITNAQTRRESIYTKLSSLGATIPATKNLSNVNTSIDSLFKNYYLPVNFLQKTSSNTKAYINSGIIPTLDTIVTFKMIPTGTSTSNFYGTFYGSRTSNHSADSFYCAYSGKGTTIREEIGANRTITSTLTTGNATTVTNTVSNMIVNGTTVSQSSTLSSFSSTLPLWIFTLNVNGAQSTEWNSNLGYMKLYWMIITKNGTRVADFIPCILCKDIAASQDSQGVARTAGAVGLWDLVSNKFFGNAGTGSFVVG